MANFVLLLDAGADFAADFRLVLQRGLDAAIGAADADDCAATWGISVVGTTFSAMTVNLRLRELMLPMLVYPILIPCLLGAILLTADSGGRQADRCRICLWLRLLIGFDIIYTALALALVETVLVG